MTFDIVPKPGVVNATKLEELTALPSPTGRYAVIEFTGALPRAALYTNWQVETNDAATLKLLADPAFDPAGTVLVANEIGTPSADPTTNASPGEVDFVSYAPKHVVLQASNSLPSILLLNDKSDPNWQLVVDGKSAELLRCNAVMRGVFLNPGKHRVEFRFKPPVGSLYVTVVALCLSLLLLGVLIISSFRAPRSSAPPERG